MYPVTISLFWTIISCTFIVVKVPPMVTLPVKFALLFTCKAPENVDKPDTSKERYDGVSEDVIVAIAPPTTDVAVILFPLKSRLVTLPAVPTIVPSSLITMPSIVPAPA